MVFNVIVIDYRHVATIRYVKIKIQKYVYFLKINRFNYIKMNYLCSKVKTNKYQL